jgi:Replication protein.
VTSRQTSLDTVSKKSAFRKGNLVHTCRRPMITLQCHVCGHRHHVLAGSRDRACPACSEYFYDRAYRRYRKKVKEMKEPKFLTLTWKPVKRQDPRIVRSMGKALTRLLHRKPYAQVWRGVLATVECKKTKSGLFYYHVHCILDGAYVPQQEISKDWKQISGFPIVHIQRIWRTTERALKYVLKYVLKGFAFQDSKDTDDFRESMKGVHYVRSYGEFYRLEYETGQHVMFPCPSCGAVGCWILFGAGEDDICGGLPFEFFRSEDP